MYNPCTVKSLKYILSRQTCTSLPFQIFFFNRNANNFCHFVTIFTVCTLTLSDFVLVLRSLVPEHALCAMSM